MTDFKTKVIERWTHRAVATTGGHTLTNMTDDILVQCRGPVNLTDLYEASPLAHYEELVEALRDVAFMGVSQSPAMNMPEGDWHARRADKMQRIAKQALAKLEGGE